MASSAQVSIASSAVRLGLEGGRFTLALGASYRDLRLNTTIDIPAPPLSVRLDGMATLQEWVGDPHGSTLLRDVVGTTRPVGPGGTLGDDELLAVIGKFPISTLAAFPGLGLDHRTVTDLLHRPSTSAHQSTT